MVLPDGNVTCLQYGELEIITGDNLGTISVWWIKSSELLQSFKAHDGPVTSLQADANKVVSSGLDMVVAVSDIITGELLHTLRGHTSPVLAIAFDRVRIVSLSSDGELRFWTWARPKVNRVQSVYRATLRVDVGSNKQADAVEEAMAPEVNEGGLGASSGKMIRGSLVNRLAGRFRHR